MNLTRQIRSILCLAATLSLAACGGGSSSGSTSGGNPTATPPTPVTAVGTITGFGSVFVNGTRYEVESGTVIAIEDEVETTGDDSRLGLGMKVRVSALDDGGRRSAQRIEFDEDLRGPIENISPDGNDPTVGTFDAVGTLVTVDANTVFDDDVGNNDGVAGIDIRDLAIGMVVEISGFPTDTGFLATRVDREFDGLGGDPDVGQPGVDGDELELKGFVESIASDNTSITVNSVVFNVDGNTIFEDGLLLNDELIGVFVEVKADVVGADFLAVRVEREDDFDNDDREGEFEIEGVLQAVDTSSSTNTFTINGLTVPVTDASSLEPLVGMRVEIKGNFNADNVLVLREAEQDVEDNVRTEDLVTTIDTGAPSFTTRLGLVIRPTGSSRVQDDAEDGGDHLTPSQFISRLQMGDRIESRGHENADSSVTWTRVARDELATDNNDFECELRGPVTSKTGDEASFNFVIQGVTVTTDNAADNEFKGANDEVLGRATFFANLQPGDVVEAESFEGDAFCMTGALDARQVEFEPDDGS